MKHNSLLLYCSGIDDVLSGSPKVAGIQVQMSFWARTFVRHGWNVYAFTNKATRDIDGIHFINRRSTWLDNHRLQIVQDVVNALKFLRKTKADLVFLRGARRDLYFLQFASLFTGAKIVFLGASDKDFVKGEELDIGNPINMKLYRKALSKGKYFITQNQFQSDMLYKEHGRESLIQPNIWLSEASNQEANKTYDAIWVANFRRLKRAEWFMNLAKNLPQYRFAFVGGVNEQDYYDKIKEATMSIPNLEFLGAQPFNEVNNLLSQSRLLVCTSEFEGFPNTFLQAWAYGVPVISTVDPSSLIQEFNLGKFIKNEDELLSATKLLLEGDEQYSRCKSDIEGYFNEHHDADMAFDKFMKYMNQ